MPRGVNSQLVSLQPHSQIEDKNENVGQHQTLQLIQPKRKLQGRRVLREREREREGML